MVCLSRAFATSPQREVVIRELKHQTFSRGRRQPEIKFTSGSRFPPTWSAVATLRRLCFAHFDVAIKREFRLYDFLAFI